MIIVGGHSTYTYAADECSNHSDILAEAAELGKFLQCNHHADGALDESGSGSGRNIINNNVNARKPTVVVAAAANRQEFAIVTWNIWFANLYWRERLRATLVETLEQSPHVVSFQEVTQNVHSIMLHCDYWRQWYDPTEERLPCSYDCSIWIRKSDATTRTTTTNDNGRTPAGINVAATNTSMVQIPTIYGRRGLYVDLKLLPPASDDETKIRVMTTHLESGMNKGDTRRKQLDTLQKAAAADRIPTFLVGDMNIDPSYPENSALPGQDLWHVTHRDDPGFTEDTYINEMRFWAHGGKTKRVRYDRIMLLNSKPNHRVVDVKLLGATPFQHPNGQSLLWPSDHFGLVARLEL